MAEIKHLIISAVIGLAAVLAGLCLQVMVSYLLERWRRKGKFAEYETLLKYIYYKGPLRALLPAILLMFVLPAMRLPETALAAILLAFERVRQIGFSLLASAGVVGIILGFAAQRSLAALFAGIQIALTQPIRIDDAAGIVENEWGWVEEITLTYGVVKIRDQRRLIVPITYFIEKPFQNWTRTTAELLECVYLYADYTLPVPEIREELQKILRNCPQWDQRVGVLQVTSANERTMELRALMSAQDSPSAWKIRCHVREKLVEFMQQGFPACLPHVRIEMERAHAATQ